MPEPGLSETLGLDALGPLTAAEYGILADAVREVEARRLEDRGVCREDVDAMLSIVDDFFAFAAASRV